MSNNFSKMAVQAFALSVGLNGCSSLQESAEAPEPVTMAENTMPSEQPAAIPAKSYTPRRQQAAPQTFVQPQIEFSPIVHLQVLEGIVRTLEVPAEDMVETAQFNNCALYPRSDESSVDFRWVLDCRYDFSEAGTYLSTYVLDKRAAEKIFPAPTVKPLADPLHNRFQG